MLGNREKSNQEQGENKFKFWLKWPRGARPHLVHGDVHAEEVEEVRGRLLCLGQQRQQAEEAKRVDLRGAHACGGEGVQGLGLHHEGTRGV